MQRDTILFDPSAEDYISSDEIVGHERDSIFHPGSSVVKISDVDDNHAKEKNLDTTSTSADTRKNFYNKMTEINKDEKEKQNTGGRPSFSSVRFSSGELGKDNSFSSNKFQESGYKRKKTKIVKKLISTQITDEEKARLLESSLNNTINVTTQSFSNTAFLRDMDRNSKLLLLVASQMSNECDKFTSEAEVMIKGTIKEMESNPLIQDSLPHGSLQKLRGSYISLVNMKNTFQRLIQKFEQKHLDIQKAAVDGSIKLSLGASEYDIIDHFVDVEVTDTETDTTGAKEEQIESSENDIGSHHMETSLPSELSKKRSSVPVGERVASEEVEQKLEFHSQSVEEERELSQRATISKTGVEQQGDLSIVDLEFEQRKTTGITISGENLCSRCGSKIMESSNVSPFKFGSIYNLSRGVFTHTLTSPPKLSVPTSIFYTPDTPNFMLSSSADVK